MQVGLLLLREDVDVVGVVDRIGQVVRVEELREAVLLAQEAGAALVAPYFVNT